MLKKLFLLVALFVVFLAYLGSRNQRPIVVAPPVAAPSSSKPSPTTKPIVAAPSKPAEPNASTAAATPASVPQPQAVPQSARPRTLADRAPTLSMQKYLSVRNGMTYQQVARVMMAPGVEQSSAGSGEYRLVMMAWQGPGVSNCIITFENGRVSAKAQLGLENVAGDWVVDVEAEELQIAATAKAEAEAQAARMDAEKREQNAAALRADIAAQNAKKTATKPRTWKLKGGDVIGTLKSFGGGKVKIETGAGEVLNLLESDLAPGDLQFIRDGLR